VCVPKSVCRSFQSFGDAHLNSVKSFARYRIRTKKLEINHFGRWIGGLHPVSAIWVCVPETTGIKVCVPELLYWGAGGGGFGGGVGAYYSGFVSEKVPGGGRWSCGKRVGAGISGGAEFDFVT